jgi:hypothetical protein
MNLATHRVAGPRWRVWCLAGLLGLAPVVAAAMQEAGEPPPDATPLIQRIQPTQGAPGAEINLTIEGANFSGGVYVSFSSPSVHAVSTNRPNPKQLQVRVQIGAKAAPGPVTLYVSNPASAAAETTFTVVAGGAAAETVQPAAPAPPATTVPTAPAAPAAVETPAAPTITPQVTSIQPSSVGRGSTVAIKVKGKNFVQGAKVAFSNPGILVTRTDFDKATELTAYLQVAADAATGQTSLFVVNPDDSEVETQFEITTAAPTTQTPPSPPATTQPSTTTTAKSTAATSGSTASFDVYNLGEVVSIFQTKGKTKGTLSVANRTLKYEEGGKEVFSAAATDVKEIGLTSIAGFSFGAFHVMLNSGKTYNFMPSSLRGSDSQSIVDALRKALR